MGYNILAISCCTGMQCTPFSWAEGKVWKERVKELKCECVFSVLPVPGVRKDKEPQQIWESHSGGSLFCFLPKKIGQHASHRDQLL